MTKKKDEINIKFGQKLKELRLSKNMSQFDLSALLDMDDRHVSRIENAQVDVRISTVSKLAQALEVPARVFFDLD